MAAYTASAIGRARRSLHGTRPKAARRQQTGTTRRVGNVEARAMRRRFRPFMTGLLR
jgi:hypothetical protein